MNDEFEFPFDENMIHFKGKKVILKCKGEMCVGIMEFAGVNTVLHNQYQVTLGRTPHWPVDPTTIRLYEERMRIHE